MENIQSLIKNQYLKHPPSLLSARYGFASLFVLTLILIGFRYQLEVAEANLSLTHSVSNAYPDSGSTITHTSVITNNGPNDATNVIIKHNVSGSIAFQSAASSGPVAGTFSGSYPNNIVTWAGISIPSGTSVTVVSFISIRDNEGCVDAMGEIVSLSETDQDLTNNKMIARICPKPTICQPITQPPGNVNIVNSSCSTNCAINGGTITAPSIGCPTGYTLEYRVNGGVWSTTLPTYSQTGPQQIIESRCKCNAVSNYAVYQLTSVTTSPGSCPDSDGDGTPNCNDGCPNDINKSSPGTCGCGVAETDSDGDGTPNCNDGCPNDANKTSPGTCGCGVTENDNDGDGIKDCVDPCDNAFGTIPNFNTTTCNCNPGYFPVASSSDEDGTVIITACNPCPAGSYCPDGTNKYLCEAGKFSSATGAISCMPCPMGKFQGSEGSTLCVNCPAGTYANTVGNTICTNCASGFNSPEGAISCTENDTDGDGTPDGADGCPNDVNKIAPGACGCGLPDTDSDGDGTANCVDGCPNDANKTSPGTCGCGVADTDSDGDGTPNCNDGCPNDANKTSPGTCGCGATDTDIDGDGIPNCNDLCPNDINKTSPGTCGCGVPDTDTDSDGTPNCNDGCPNDANKTSPGTCGCGVADTDSDGDGTPNCNDGCPNDANKTSPGTCGCGIPDTDSDGDGTANCNDGCPNDANKTSPGTCGCGVPDTDIDGDGSPNCNDLCPNDLNKTSPGTCGCGVPDTDTDGDGTPNCTDLCPNDRNKIAPGTCGCGVADTDSDHDGTPNCNDGCPNDVNKTSPGNCGCGTADTPNCCPTLPDSDCDGVGNTCDVCPGGNDKIDNNNDGKPDCKYPPSYAQIISAWKCGNQKVLICHRLSRKNQTLCINYSDLATHIAHGDYLGSCNNATCGSGIAGTDGTSLFELQQDLHARPIEAHLYPNPAQDQVILEFTTTSGGKGLIEIIDITGKMIKQITSSFVNGTNNIRLDVNTLSSGLHFVRVKDQNNKIVILKMNKL